MLCAVESAPTPGVPAKEGRLPRPVLGSPAGLQQMPAWGSSRESAWLVCGLPLCLPPSCFPSIIVSSNAPCFPVMCPKWGSFTIAVSASRDVSGLICSGTHFFIFLMVQGIRRALLQHHLPKESAFPLSAFFAAQFSHLHVVLGNTRERMVSATTLFSLSSASVRQSPLPALPAPSLSQPPQAQACSRTRKISERIVPVITGLHALCCSINRLYFLGQAPEPSHRHGCCLLQAGSLPGRSEDRGSEGWTHSLALSLLMHQTWQGSLSQSTPRSFLPGDLAVLLPPPGHPLPSSSHGWLLSHHLQLGPPPLPLVTVLLV